MAYFLKIRIMPTVWFRLADHIFHDYCSINTVFHTSIRVKQSSGYKKLTQYPKAECIQNTVQGGLARDDEDPETSCAKTVCSMHFT